MTRILAISPSAPDPALVRAAAKVINRDGLVAFPTETVYGLGAHALHAKAIAKIFSAKGRPQDNPLIVHVADISELSLLARDIPPEARLLAERFWPGPLTMVLRRKEGVPDAVTAGLDTVAVRMPSHPVARALLRAAKAPIAAPSANLSTRPSPTSAAHVIEDLMGRVDIIIDGGSCAIGLESTVVDLTHRPALLLRPGGITLEMLNEVMAVEQYRQKGKEPPRSPGMKYRHYAPKAKVIIVEGSPEKVGEKINSLLKEYGRMRIGVLTTSERWYDSMLTIYLGATEEEIAHNLFAALRSFDRNGIEVVLSESIAAKGIGLAITNRLEKASYERVRA